MCVAINVLMPMAGMLTLYTAGPSRTQKGVKGASDKAKHKILDRLHLTSSTSKDKDDFWYGRLKSSPPNNFTPGAYLAFLFMNLSVLNAIHRDVAALEEESVTASFSGKDRKGCSLSLSGRSYCVEVRQRMGLRVHPCHDDICSRPH